MQSARETFPKEFFIRIDNNENFLGRLILNKARDNYNLEIDIVSNESKKIYQHVDILYNQMDAEEAIELGVQKLAEFLKKPE